MKYEKPVLISLVDNIVHGPVTPDQLVQVIVLRVVRRREAVVNQEIMPVGPALLLALSSLLALTAVVGSANGMLG